MLGCLEASITLTGVFLVVFGAGEVDIYFVFPFPLPVVEFNVGLSFTPLKVPPSKIIRF
jgi:hypothetical protein